MIAVAALLFPLYVVWLVGGKILDERDRKRHEVCIS